MFMLIAGVLAVPAALEFTNRILEEYIIPGREMKRAIRHPKNPNFQLGPVACDMALTEAEKKELVKSGAFDIMRRGSNRHFLLASKGKLKAHSCEHCQRLL
jgi:hypothetical protein